MRVLLVSFGKLKTDGLRETANYYLKLCGTWNPTDEIELKPIAVPDKSPATRRQIQEKEGEILLERLSRELGARGIFFLLDEKGKSWTTEAWAESVRAWEREGFTEVAFCVGSSLGFSEAVRKKARGLLSLGAHTMPHELARVVLYEQVYRAWSVTRGHPYHNAGS